MSKTDKELAVELACATINAIAKNPTPIHKPLSAKDIDSILHDCYSSIQSLDECYK